MPSRIRLIAVDIDGTLLPSTGNKISQRNCRALCAAEAAGVRVAIATGRRHAFAAPVIGQIGLGSATAMISSNGAVVRSLDGELLHRTLLPAGTARELCGALRRFGETILFTFDREGPAGLVVEDMAALERQIGRWVEANRPYLAEVRPLERAFEGGEAPVQGMLCGPVALVRHAEAAMGESALAGRVAMHRTEYPERDLGILDLLPPQCSKGVALGRLAAQYGVEAGEVLAMGDNLNDLSMLEYAGLAVVMGNAEAEMKAAAREAGWQVGASNDEDGVAQVIEAVLQGRRPEGEMRKALFQEV
jgi:hydroxymethylpyrimidine pyrophosphatase-like HAD family hydrolase